MRRMQSYCLALVLLALTTTVASRGLAGEPLDADQILRKSRDRPDGKDVYSEVKLILTDQNGSTRSRDLLYLQKDYDKNDKLTLYFTGPSEVKGVAFQSVSYDESQKSEDDQWIYLPAFRQVRRLASSDKRGSFMGSEFAYIDLDKLRATDYQQKIAGEEVVLGRSCHVIERAPISEKIVARTGYSKTRVWVDKQTYIVLKQTYYDANGVLFKEMTVKKLAKLQDIWTVMQSDMRDLVNRKASSLVFSNVKYDLGLSDAIFQQNVMKTGVHSGNLPAIR